MEINYIPKDGLSEAGIRSNVEYFSNLYLKSQQETDAMRLKLIEAVKAKSTQ